MEVHKTDPCLPRGPLMLHSSSSPPTIRMKELTDRHSWQKTSLQPCNVAVDTDQETSRDVDSGTLGEFRTVRAGPSTVL
eukprot:scaffold282_cov345-Pavlova_lutheri.AAC.43